MITPVYNDGFAQLFNGDCRTVLREIPSASVHTIVTSPPYLAQRDYQVVGQVGLESTIAAYVETIVSIMREVRRVMRPDATLWLNLGDKYNGSGGAGGDYDSEGIHEGQPTFGPFADPTLPAKSLCMIPARVAIAMQVDGWILRNEIIWAKKSAAPQSVTDRLTNATERIYLLTKQATYFYDRLGYIEPSSGQHRIDRVATSDTGTRNSRDFWLLGPEGFAGEHHAVFPSEIPRRAILLGTSAKGVCGECGAAWRRVLKPQSETPRLDYNGKNADLPAQSSHRRLLAGVRGARAAGGDHDNPFPAKETVGWQPTCEHVDAEVVPATILDPFAGSGTTLLVAKALGRRSIGTELSADYCCLAEKRISSVPLPMGVGV